MNVFAGGNIDVAGSAAEMEGKVVTLGNFTQNKGPEFSYRGYNVGLVGKGSQVRPPDGTDFLTIGGKFSIAEGNTIWTNPGRIRYAEAGDIQGNVDSPSVQDPAAASEYRGVVPGLTARSSCLATKPVTGRVDYVGQMVHLVGDGTSMTQIFEVPGSIPDSGLNPLAGVDFEGIPDDATIIVNMLGTEPQIITNGGTIDDWSDWNQHRSHLLWNFPNAQSIALRGFQQFQGSVLIGNPASTAQVSVPGVAGRFFTAGSILHVSEPGFGGTGGELHSYPFLGEIPTCASDTPPDDPNTNITINKTWVVDGESYVDGEQPYGLSATPKLNGESVAWGSKQTGKTAGDSVTIGETTAGVPSVCTIDSSQVTSLNGAAVAQNLPYTLTLDEGDNTVNVTNTVSCKPRIKMVKRVVGGTRVPSDWNLVATPQKEALPLAGAVADPQEIEEEPPAPEAQPAPETQSVPGSANGSYIYVKPGKKYDLSETGPDDYYLNSLQCNVGEDGAYVDVAEVEIKPLSDITCVFENTVTETPIPPLRIADSQLTLVKVVDNGQTKKTFGPKDWTLHAVGDSDELSGVSGSDDVTQVFVDAGTYKLSETGPAGYKASDWKCEGATSFTATSVTVKKGDNAVCTVTNTAIPDGVTPKDPKKKGPSTKLPNPPTPGPQNPGPQNPGPNGNQLANTGSEPLTSPAILGVGLLAAGAVVAGSVGAARLRVNRRR
ncbi:choice-of-anchor A family protein [Leucobacter insecticola]|uniref:Choice-of-anchor A family protein n=1 Tax=Leucobacter insecticola TaxID=2714934 RepID=A0A6G8FLB1_9MICO|nr:choice-of-anchor A family protein [Leucobacter insecticola]QIM17141.1 choice-of-anchor A family protein [Leucobacter insecticola]